MLADIPDFNAWFSLLGLLSPSEYFVTVDNSVLWQRHVAWAKPKGDVLRTYVTQRFSSNMVFLSLMLASEINVFFNSSHETADMRAILGTQAYSSLKFWIGIIIALDALVTIIGLLTTFTLWGMISAISDENTHALLRSSIGQYVIGLPPRFIVASLYLFLLWLTLFFVELIKGPLQIAVVFIICFLFFQVVVPLSAFGRLIMHTGGMARRRVLNETFEKELLPSGLHASLLIKATHTLRRNTTAIDQYKKQLELEALGTQSEDNQSDESRTTPGRKMPVRMGEIFDDDVYFPRASILNSAKSTELPSVVDRALSVEKKDLAKSTAQVIADVKKASGSFASVTLGRLPKPLSVINKEPTDDGINRRERFNKARQSVLNMGIQSTLRNVEWAAEYDVRDLYDIEPPAPIADEEAVRDLLDIEQTTPIAEDEGREDNDQRGFAFRLPAASLMNNTGGLKKFAKLVVDDIAFLKAINEVRRLSGSDKAGESFDESTTRTDLEAPSRPPAETDHLLSDQKSQAPTSKSPKKQRFGFQKKPK